MVPSGNVVDPHTQAGKLNLFILSVPSEKYVPGSFNGSGFF